MDKVGIGNWRGLVSLEEGISRDFEVFIVICFGGEIFYRVKEFLRMRGVFFWSSLFIMLYERLFKM